MARLATREDCREIMESTAEHGVKYTGHWLCETIIALYDRIAALEAEKDELMGRIGYLENGAYVAQAKTDALEAENRRLKEELASATALEPHETF